MRIINYRLTRLLEECEFNRRRVKAFYRYIKRFNRLVKKEKFYE